MATRCPTDDALASVGAVLDLVQRVVGVLDFGLGDYRRRPGAVSILERPPLLGGGAIAVVVVLQELQPLLAGLTLDASGVQLCRHALPFQLVRVGVDLALEVSGTW